MLFPESKWCIWRALCADLELIAVTFSSKVAIVLRTSQENFHEQSLLSVTRAVDLNLVIRRNARKTYILVTLTAAY